MVSAEPVKRRRGRRVAVSELTKLGFADVLPEAELLRGGPSWCSWELCRTEPAREKLRMWLASDPVRPWRLTTKAVNARLRSSLYGCPVMSGHVIRTIAELPAPMGIYAAERVSILCAGGSLHGTASAPLQTGDRPWFVVLSAPVGAEALDLSELRETTAHEAAHTWLEPEPGNRRRMATIVEQHHRMELSLDRLPESERAEVRLRRARYASLEDQTRELVRVLGFEAAK